MKDEIQIENYNLKASNGNHIRVATLVRFNGDEIRFTEKLSKREIVEQLNHQMIAANERYGEMIRERDRYSNEDLINASVDVQRANDRYFSIKAQIGGV
jgi:hypothetical protein